jgi:N-carbamoyl-L-amino-acid hydrolase
MTPAIPRVNGQRLLDRIAALARIGDTGDGGVSRPAYGEADIAGRKHVRTVMSNAGLAPRIDTAGNTLARRANDDPRAPSILIGSHTDSVPNGGRFDGALGVLAAIEVAQAIGELGIQLTHPLEVVDFQNEEGSLVGSRAMAGRLTSADLELKAQSGLSLGEGIRVLGGDPDRLHEAKREPGSIAGYVELHIEQGKVLENGGDDIGVVEGIVGIHYWDVTIDGEARHSGATPMAGRKDALLTAARFVQMVNEVVTSQPGAHVGTVGRLSVEPGAPNVVPGRVRLTLELRDLDTAAIERLYERIASRAAAIAQQNETSIELLPTHRVIPSPTDPELRAAIVHAAGTLGLRSRPMPSGAGHDAQNMAVLGPSAMIFVPSVDGLSHSPREYTKDQDVINGANVMLGTIARRFGVG